MTLQNYSPDVIILLKRHAEIVMGAVHDVSNFQMIL